MIPLYEGGRVTGSIEDARAKWNTAHEQHERVVDAQRKSCQLGVTTVVDVVVAQRRLLCARYDQSKARYEFIRERAALRVRAGALTRADLEEMDGWLAHGGEAADDGEPATQPDAAAPAAAVPGPGLPDEGRPDEAASPAMPVPTPAAVASDPWIQVSPNAR